MDLSPQVAPVASAISQMVETPATQVFRTELVMDVPTSFIPSAISVDMRPG